MTTQTVQSAGPVVMPRVNLMPPEIAEAQRLHQIQRGMAGAVLVSAVLVAGLYFHAKQGMTSAQHNLASAQSQNVALESKYHALDYVTTDFTEAQAKKELLDQAMSQEIRWSFILQDLTTRVPNNVWLTGMTATETSVPGATPTSTTTTPGEIPGIGNVTFSGTAFEHDDVANWLQAVARVKGFSNASFSSSAKGVIGPRGDVTFVSTVNVTNGALSNRYTSKAGS